MTAPDPQPDRLEPGTPVVYRPYPGAPGEPGVVIRDAGPGSVFVRYLGSETPKSTRIADLARGGV